jgi:signal transduction histidine kinase
MAYSVVAVFVVLTAVCGAGIEPKRVLVVHSFGSVAPPFTTHSIAFETELVEKMGKRVDLDEVSLDMARYADPNLQEALVEYLQKRQAHWQPDLVVPIGSPAGVFVEQYRDRLFPETPILYTGMDRRRLSPHALERNAAFIGENFDGPGFIEDILQIAPATKNIAIVLGASAVEQYWAAAFRKEFEPFTNRINFIWLNDLSLDQMLEKTRALPPDSYIFLILLLRDATGVTHNADEALQRIHAVANAPINGIFQHQLGLGIVGGRLYQAELEGIESARTAVRILHGEPASSFPPRIVGPLSPRYDWRELQRWKIDEKLLPPGSTVLYRTPSLWEQHRALIIGGISICVVETLLIAGLVVNRIRRRHAERSLSESEDRVALAADEMRRLQEEIAHVGRVSMMGQLASALAHEINQPIGAILRNAEAAELFMQSKTPDLEEIRAILADIRADDQRAGGVIDRMRALLKRHVLDTQLLDLTELVGDVAKLARTDAATRHVKLTVNLPADLPSVRGDRVHLQQVLLNLILNGMDALNRAGQENRRVTVSVRVDAARTVEIAVSDTGHGIAAEKLAQVFDPFFTTKPDGMGMGLPISRTIVESHGGRLWAENNDGTGATFRFTLPVAEEASAS